MTQQEANENIGKSFKYRLCDIWDVIKNVSAEGYITGDFITAPVEDCRLKQEVPAGLQNYQKQKSDAGNSGL